jgi:dihydrofolate reductase
MISLLVAMDRNHVIGFDNGMPWHLPADLQFFKAKTTGNKMIMGRKTYESIGKPLPNRKNIVLTRKHTDFPEGIEVINDLETVKNWNAENPGEELFVIGGGKIFDQAISYADRMYITWIDAAFEGDTFFPEFQENEWQLTSKEKGIKNEKNPYDYYFLQYDRK